MASKQPLTLSESVTSKVEDFYLNEFANPNAFKRLPLEEKTAVAAEAALCEFVNVTKVVDSLFKGKKSIDNQELAKISAKDNAYFRDIDKSSGDIRKTAHHTALKNLLNYALQSNASSSRSGKDAGITQFNQAAQNLLACADQFERNAARFKSIIAKEATTVNSKQLGTAFYRLAVYMLQTTGDILYANSLNADFDYNQKVPSVTNVYFSYNDGVADSMLMYINFLNTAFRNGKIFNALDGNLNEQLENAVDQISLNESVLDTVFGLVTHFKVLDLALLWPIYITRAVAYWVLYTYAILKDVTLGIEDSIKLHKQHTITKSDFDAFKQNSARRAIAVTQGLSRAEASIDMDARQDKRALENMSSNVLL